jgi:riboflavin synthase
MFTGIVKGTARVAEIEDRGEFRRLHLAFPAGSLSGLERGASVAISGVCLTAVEHQGDVATFDVIDETLRRTTLGARAPGDLVNFERAARFGDEIGGHLLSGHVWGTAEIVDRQDSADNCALELGVAPGLAKYVLEKGYIGIDGASLTIGVVDRARGTFRLHLIPETLAVTTLGSARVGDRVNVEVDAMTQAVVDTVERVLEGQ